MAADLDALVELSAAEAEAGESKSKPTASSTYCTANTEEGTPGRAADGRRAAAATAAAADKEQPLSPGKAALDELLRLDAKSSKSKKGGGKSSKGKRGSSEKRRGQKAEEEMERARSPVVSIDSGFNHNAALTEAGDLYVWGKFQSDVVVEEQQEGAARIGRAYGDQQAPRRLPSTGAPIVQVCCSYVVRWFAGSKVSEE